MVGTFGLRLWFTIGLAAVLASVIVLTSRADDSGASIADRRLDLMRTRAQAIGFRAVDADFPRKLESEPLFRYDDPTRGYVDGTVWRLGASGRPLGIITAELHPRYAGNPCVVYDLLSFSPMPFQATSKDFTWTPSGSALQIRHLPDGPEPAGTKTQRMLQIKKIMRRFSGSQDVEGELVQLRLLPQPIDRYRPASHDLADAAIFLFVNGRNPGMMLLLECDGTKWSYAVARLSHPSVLSVSLDGDVVWNVPHATLDSSNSYYATNGSAEIPGDETSE